MDRSDWLKEQRRATEERYDAIWAPLYGEKWGLYSNATHQEFIRKLLGYLPQRSHILDAACGAGRYLPLLLDGGHLVVGIDQSAGMLSRLKAKYPEIQVEKVGLQEISFQEVFEAAICMDAMEHVCPEDWPVVLRNFWRALEPQGYLYFTVEIAEEKEIADAFQRGRQMGLPIVYGEYAREYTDEDVYHYYPAIQQVKEWLQQVGFILIEVGDGDGYHHYIIRKKTFE